MKRELCRGFASWRIDREAEQIFETKYAVLSDGRVLRADERKKSDCFEDGQTYRETSMTMDDIRAMLAKGEVEFIGNYPVPKVAEKADGVL